MYVRIYVFNVVCLPASWSLREAAIDYYTQSTDCDGVTHM